jgi:ribosomal protein S18 acetylase RimI-like enzyme
MRATIRPASPDDLDTIAELWRDFAKDQQRFLRTSRLTKGNVRAVRDHLGDLAALDQVFVAEVDGVIAGFTAIVVNLPRLDMYFAVATISDLYVDPKYRGQGLGRRLLDRAVSRIREAGLHAVNLSVAAGNEAARKLYRSAGFRPMQETLLLPLDTDYVKFGPEAKED